MIQFFNTTLDDYLKRVSSGGVTPLDSETLFFIEDKGAIYKGLTLIADSTLSNDSFKLLEDKLSNLGVRNYLVNSYKYTINTPYTITGAFYVNTYYTDIYTARELPKGTYTLTVSTNGTWVPNPPNNTPMDPNQKYCGLYIYRKNISGDPVQETFIDMSKGYTTINIEIQDTYWIRLDAYADGIKETMISFYDIKLERGRISTDYSPAWEDLESMPKRWSSIIELPDTLAGYGINDAVTLEAFNNHITNLENPHGITKDMIQLDRVENYNVQEILSFLKKENILSALGYTPVDETNSTLKGTSLVENLNISYNTLVDAYRGDLYIQNTQKGTQTQTYNIYLGAESLGSYQGGVKSDLRIVSTYNYDGQYESSLKPLMLFSNMNENVTSATILPMEANSSIGNTTHPWIAAYISRVYGTADDADKINTLGSQPLRTNKQANGNILYEQAKVQIPKSGVSFIEFHSGSEGGPAFDTGKGQRLGNTLNLRARGDSNSEEGASAGQLFFGYNNTNETDKIFYRSHGTTANQGWGDWRELAFRDLVVSKAGDTMQGTLTLAKGGLDSVFAKNDVNSGALNLNGSNIYRLRSIYFDEKTEDSSRGIHFINSGTVKEDGSGDLINATVDSLWATNGNLYLTSNRRVSEPKGINDSSLILHSQNYEGYAVSIHGGDITSPNFGPFHIIRSNVLSTALGNQVTAATLGFKILYQSESTPTTLGYIGMAKDIDENIKLYKYDSGQGGATLILDANNFSDFASPQGHTHEYVPLAGTANDSKITGDVLFEMPINANSLIGIGGQVNTSTGGYWKLSSDYISNGVGGVNLKLVNAENGKITVTKNSSKGTVILELLNENDNTIIPKLLDVRGGVSVAGNLELKNTSSKITGPFGTINYDGGIDFTNTSNKTTIKVDVSGNATFGGKITGQGLNITNSAGASLLSVEGSTIKMSATLDLGNAAVQANSFIGETFGTYVGATSGEHAGKISNFIGTVNNVWIKYENGKYYLGTKQATPN